jgi:hypothetical protein
MRQSCRPTQGIAPVASKESVCPAEIIITSEMQVEALGARFACKGDFRNVRV